MNANKPMFGPVVLEITYDSFIKKTSSFHQLKHEEHLTFGHIIFDSIVTEAWNM